MKIDVLENWLIKINRFMIGLIMSVMFGLVFFQVLARYIGSISFAWIDESVGFMMVWLTYLGAGLALREGRLVGFDLLQQKLPEHYIYLLRAVLGLLILVFMTALIYWGWRFAAFGYNRETSVMQISKAIPYAAIPVGAFFMSLHLVLFFKRFIHSKWEHEGDTVVSISEDLFVD